MRNEIETLKNKIIQLRKVTNEFKAGQTDLEDFVNTVDYLTYELTLSYAALDLRADKYTLRTKEKARLSCKDFFYNLFSTRRS